MTVEENLNGGIRIPEYAIEISDGSTLNTPHSMSETVIRTDSSSDDK